MKMHQVIFQPSGRRGEIPEGKTILEASRSLGVGIESVCGGKKSCGKCRIRIESGTFDQHGIHSHPDHLSPFTEEEGKLLGEKERSEGIRLACAAAIRGDVLIFVPEESRTGKQVVRKEAVGKGNYPESCHPPLSRNTYPPHAGGSPGRL